MQVLFKGDTTFQDARSKCSSEVASVIALSKCRGEEDFMPWGSDHLHSICSFYKDASNAGLFGSQLTHLISVVRVGFQRACREDNIREYNPLSLYPTTGGIVAKCCLADSTVFG